MRSEKRTETEMGEVIQEAIRAAKEYRKSPTPENKREYDRLFEKIYKHFYGKVYGIIRSQKQKGMSSNSPTLSSWRFGKNFIHFNELKAKGETDYGK